MKAVVITVSDGVSAGTREDLSGARLAQLVEQAGFELVGRMVVADEVDQISSALVEAAQVGRLVLTTGGTGLGPRDVTPEATRRVIERTIPGLAHMLLSRGLESTPMAALSRALAGNRGQTLIINFPGSPRAVEESWDAIAPVLGHALALLQGDTSH